MDDFKACAQHSLGDQVHAWDEAVVQPLIEIGQWYKKQDTTIEIVLGGVAAAGLNSLIAWLAKIVGLSAAEVTGPIILAFAAGVGIGTGLNVVIDCAGKL